MVVAKESPYEEFRLRRVEENKQRMEALNLPKLCQDLHSSSVKSSPMKKSTLGTREKQLVVVRRSSRLSNTPSPVYKQVIVQRVQIPRRVCKGRDFSNQDESIAERAEKLQGDLPSFTKIMLKSHVSGGFWLGLPAQFCRSHLQKQDGIITLIDEQGEEFETVYLARKTGLSGGWMGFAVSHNLAYGDALTFHLLPPAAFKVYISRVGNSGQGPEI